jgi:hypothetical protein
LVEALVAGPANEEAVLVCLLNAARTHLALDAVMRVALHGGCRLEGVTVLSTSFLALETEEVQRALSPSGAGSVGEQMGGGECAVVCMRRPNATAFLLKTLSDFSDNHGVHVVTDCACLRQVCDRFFKCQLAGSTTALPLANQAPPSIASLGTLTEAVCLTMALPEAEGGEGEGEGGERVGADTSVADVLRAVAADGFTLSGAAIVLLAPQQALGLKALGALPPGVPLPLPQRDGVRVLVLVLVRGNANWRLTQLATSAAAAASGGAVRGGGGQERLARALRRCAVSSSVSAATKQIDYVFGKQA